MCGRFTVLAPREQVEEAFSVVIDEKNYQENYNVAPGQNVLAIIQNAKSKRAGYLRWGLVPSWAKDEKIGYKMINARSESVHEKPSFRNLLIQKRCLIVADSFYEWQKEGTHKQPKRIQLADRNLFAFAGLWDLWEHENKKIFTCTILTKAANAFMQSIHTRMPIILPKDKEAEWIRPEKMAPETAQQFLQSLEDEEMKAYDVSAYVNAAKHNDAQCIAPLVK
ncbi:SOS response-associated peptidase [Virgibacillus sp. 179-BFC.A HS]|uniref:Abasic site processing protein n=1 Tax=Tigheibacillus jepli TaxID=3035914 RepID=A0ABU5CN32_9BACI|nr:SOS response-associated peptidase [Virgibacillus sp. 179-BFC.A HS]MDY0406853.1 SOS response-associated peptidase [Virgibacillus sp. 179-BFC.A HS]